MWTYVIVEGSTEKDPGLFGKSTHKDYLCYLSYSSIQDNLPLLKNYFRNYCSIDYDRLEWNRRPPIDDYNCVRAIMTYYFREQSLHFKCKTYGYSRLEDFPLRGPDKETEHYKVWVDTVGNKEITTPKSAAWMLYETVGYGKISIDDARQLVRERFPEHFYSWDQIMQEFIGYGGAYTKKYLRRVQ